MVSAHLGVMKKGLVPPLDFELTGEQLRELQAAVHPLSDSEEFGIDLYIRTLEFLEAIAN